MTLLLAFGKYGGFRINKSSEYIRIVIGYFAIWFIVGDLDRILVNLSHAVKISEEVDNNAKNDTK